jgi:hypothetical protein
LAKVWLTFEAINMMRYKTKNNNGGKGVGFDFFRHDRKQKPIGKLKNAGEMVKTERRCDHSLS